MTDIERQFESLKKEIDDLKLRKISDERERERLEKEINEIKQQIKEQFGIQPELFEETMQELQRELQLKKKELINKLNEAKEKIK